MRGILMSKIARSGGFAVNAVSADAPAAIVQNGFAAVPGPESEHEDVLFTTQIADAWASSIRPYLAVQSSPP